MDSLSFDPLVVQYDETRTFDQGCFDAALDYLAERFPPRAFPHVFEPGIGTGRIAVPLAERGYRVTGVDISTEMMAILEERLKARPLPISYQVADVTDLPFEDAEFDLAVAVHLFYFIPEWRRAADEILRVVRRDGPLVLMHTGMGEEVPALTNRYHELCTERGCDTRMVGVTSTSELVAYLRDIGCGIEEICDRWTWTTRVRLDKAIGYLASRAYSYTTKATDDVHRWAVNKLTMEFEQSLGEMSGEFDVPNRIRLVLVTR